VDVLRGLYLKENPTDPLKKLVGMILDDHGDDSIVRSCVVLAPTPGWINDHGKHIKLATATATELRKARIRTPAYLSVAIPLVHRPTAAELAIFVRRAKSFHTVPADPPNKKRPKVTGCRLVEEVTTLNEFPIADSTS
jgi:hypothetical protein